MGKKRDKDCKECDGQGFVYDFLGGCGDPECCGGPWQVQCTACDNDWEFGDEDEDEYQSDIQAAAGGLTQAACEG